MAKMLIKILMIMMQAASLNSFSQSLPDIGCDSSHCELRILSWNIYMLPSLVMPNGIRVRSKLIASRLKDADFDIVVFQEAFNSKAREALRELLKDTYPYSAGPANEKKQALRLNSGIWIVSKIPLKITGEIEFSRAQGFDVFSRKGAMMVEAGHNGTLFQIVGTHLNAGETQKVRDVQYRELQEKLLAPNRKDDVPQIICGDFNTDKHDSDSYHRMISILQVQDYEIKGACLFSYDGLNNDLISPGYRKQELLDYIFYQSNGIAGARIERSFHRYSHAWSRRHKDLSDHYAVAASIQF